MTGRQLRQARTTGRVSPPSTPAAASGSPLRTAPGPAPLRNAGRRAPRSVAGTRPSLRARCEPSRAASARRPLRPKPRVSRPARSARPRTSRGHRRRPARRAGQTPLVRAAPPLKRPPRRSDPRHPPQSGHPSRTINPRSGGRPPPRISRLRPSRPRQRTTRSGGPAADPETSQTRERPPQMRRAFFLLGADLTGNTGGEG